MFVVVLKCSVNVCLSLLFLLRLLYHDCSLSFTCRNQLNTENAVRDWSFDTCVKYGPYIFVVLVY